MTPAALFTLNIHADIALFYTDNECSRKNLFIYAYMTEYTQYFDFTGMNILKKYDLLYIFERSVCH